MRKHGWQLPYHLLQVVAVSVFLALGVAFYVFFVPFVGWKKFQYIIMGIYTSLITIVFSLYIWCAAADPGDPGIFKSKKYLNIMDNGKSKTDNESKHDRNSISSRHETNASIAGEGVVSPAGEIEGKTKSSYHPSCCMILLGWCSCALVCCSKQHEESHEQQMSEDGMFYCSLCKVEVFKYSKHCRVCDKCVDQFDHHCRWLNNCIGKRNYRQFFTLMVSALLLLILQWSTGILVMICCFLERKRFSTEISSKLGSSFSFAPFIIVVACCTILAMIATLPLVQLFFFHVLLIKKGISTYDYIIAMREQKQQLVRGEQSPQMSPAPSSIAGLSTGSSFNTFHRAAWCTPPRLFLEDRFDVVAPDTNMPLNSPGKRNMWEQPIRKKKSGTVKINPWTLARLNGNEVSRIAAEAKKSKILQSLGRREVTSGLETDSSFDSSGRMAPRPENRRRTSKRIRLPSDHPFETLAKVSAKAVNNHLVDLDPETPNSLAPLQLEARSAFRTSRAMSAAAGNVISSPESSLQSPDIRHPSHVSSSAEEEARGLVALSEAGSSKQMEIPLSRCASDGYEASGGEDSDRIPTRTMLRSTDFTKFFYSSG